MTKVDLTQPLEVVALEGAPEGEGKTWDAEYSRTDFEGDILVRTKAPQGAFKPTGEHWNGKPYRLRNKVQPIDWNVPAGQTPLNATLGHKYLDVVSEGAASRDSGEHSPYHGHSLEHCLHGIGWVQRDLRLALDQANRKPSYQPPAWTQDREVVDEEAVREIIYQSGLRRHGAKADRIVEGLREHGVLAQIEPPVDPLTEALDVLDGTFTSNKEAAEILRAELAKRGLELAKRTDGEASNEQE